MGLSIKSTLSSLSTYAKSRFRFLFLLFYRSRKFVENIFNIVIGDQFFLGPLVEVIKAGVLIEHVKLERAGKNLVLRETGHGIDVYGFG